MRGINLKNIKPLDKADIAGVGPAPQLEWLPIAKLVFDDSYQRPIRAQGVTHLRRIAMQFDWRLFTPVIVAPVEGGGYAVIDGQHRTHAAALRGIDKVPCQIVLADRKLQAKAFAGMNGNQAIRLAPFQLHRAALASGDVKAQAVDHVCQQAGVSIAANLQADQMERGDTVAVMTIYKVIALYGVPVAIAALEAIVKTADGHPGLVNALAVRAYASLFARRRDLMDHASLLDTLDDFELADEMAAATRAHAKQLDQREALATAIEAFLDQRINPPTSSFSGLTREPQTSPAPPQETSP
jgi:hypothetical protein